jgi:thymidylate kinase
MTITDLYLKQYPWKDIEMIYIQVPPSICMERIKNRSRKGEENITIDYLLELHERYERTFNNLNDCIHIDGTLPSEDVVDQVIFKLFSSAL